MNVWVPQKIFLSVPYNLETMLKNNSADRHCLLRPKLQELHITRWSDFALEKFRKISHRTFWVGLREVRGVSFMTKKCTAITVRLHVPTTAAGTQCSQFSRLKENFKSSTLPMSTRIIAGCYIQMVTENSCYKLSTSQITNCFSNGFPKPVHKWKKKASKNWTVWLLTLKVPCLTWTIKGVNRYNPKGIQL